VAVLVSTQVILIRAYVSFYENEQRSPCEATRQRLPAVRLPLRRAVEHRDALRAAVVEHGSLLVRGLRWRDVAEIEAVFRRLGSLMTEKEAFAARRRYSDGLYSSSKWPAERSTANVE